MAKTKGISFVVIAVLVSFLVSGCSVVFQKGRRSDIEKISNLESQLADLQKARRALERSLSREIANKQVKLEMAERGLVVTFLAEILFDSGKNTIKKKAMPILSKVARVINTVVPDLYIGVEGHTDNQPIKRSRWRSNWELSTGRATSVVHCLIDKSRVKPQRLSAIGYGEYKPVESNKTKEGRRKNRRVEIVILPKLAKSEDLPSKIEGANLK